MQDSIHHVQLIAQTLAIPTQPVGITYTDDKPDIEIDSGTSTVCAAIPQASKGAIIMLSEERCACPGGQNHLGLKKRPIPWKFLVEGEKLWIDVKTAMRMFASVEKIAQPPYGLAPRIYLYPVSSGLLKPDLVLMLVNAEQASRLIILNQFMDGMTPSFEMKGAACWSMITYPLISGNFNLSVGDITARRAEGWDPNLMVASIPLERIYPIAQAIDLSTAGRARQSEEFEQILKERMKSKQ